MASTLHLSRVRRRLAASRAEKGNVQTFAIGDDGDAMVLGRGLKTARVE
jgi:hypothetical protein